MRDKVLATKIKKQFLKEIIKKDYVVSCSLVGSYLDKKKISTKSDIDIVVITKTLNKLNFQIITKLVEKQFLKSRLFNKYKLFINTSFGPLKFKIKNTLVIHLMIYDIKSHLKHTIESPFTCFDWERSNVYEGLRLKNIFPVGNLQYRDFNVSRRGLKNYYDNLKLQKIEYKVYQFKKNNYYTKTKFKKISKKDSYEFMYHIIKNLLCNLYKFINQKNEIMREFEFKKLFLEITSNDKIFYDDFCKIKYAKYKNLKNLSGSKENYIKKSNSFIKKFEKYFRSYFAEQKKIIFMRHAKTTVHKKIFLGQKLNPNIIKIGKNYNKFKDIDSCFSSPLKRSINTAKKYYNKKIYISDNLLEIDYGRVEGKDYKYLINNFNHINLKWNKNKDPKFPLGENYSDVLKRLNRFININLYKQSNQNTLVVTHNVLLRCLIGNHFKIKKNLWYRINIKYLESFEFVIIKNSLVSNINRNILFIPYGLNL